MQIEAALQVNHAGKAHGSCDRRLVSGKAERELASNRMTHDEDFPGIEIVALRNLRQKPVSIHDVLERSGPGSSRLAEAAIFQLPCGHTFPAQRGTEMTGVKQIVFGAPEASMDVHGDGKRSLACRESKISELAGIGAVGQTNISRRWLEREDFVGQANSALIVAGDGRARKKPKAAKESHARFRVSNVQISMPDSLSQISDLRFQIFSSQIFRLSS